MRVGRRRADRQEHLKLFVLKSVGRILEGAALSVDDFLAWAEQGAEEVAPSVLDLLRQGGQECPQCKSTRLRRTVLAVRSADEPNVYKLECMDCAWSSAS